MIPSAVILCGGRGTRLVAVAGDGPKALAPVAGRPFLEWQIDWLARGGVTRVHLAAGYRAERIAAWAEEVSGVRCQVSGRADRVQVSGRTEGSGRGDSGTAQASGTLPDTRNLPARRSSGEGGTHDTSSSPPDTRNLTPETFPSAFASIPLTLSIEPRPLGTGGGLRYAADFAEGDTLLVVNGDTLLPGLDFQALETSLEKSSKAWMVMAVTRVDDAARYGTVAVKDERVTEFLEKGRAAAGWINGGVYLIRRAAIDSIPRDTSLSIETDLFPNWARDERIAAVPTPPPLLDMGTPAGLASMAAWLAGQA